MLSFEQYKPNRKDRRSVKQIYAEYLQLQTDFEKLTKDDLMSREKLFSFFDNYSNKAFFFLFLYGNKPPANPNLSNINLNNFFY